MSKYQNIPGPSMGEPEIPQQLVSVCFNPPMSKYQNIPGPSMGEPEIPQHPPLLINLHVKSLRHLFIVSDLFLKNHRIKEYKYFDSFNYLN